MCLNKTIFSLLLFLFSLSLSSVCQAEETTRYEYKIVPLGSLTALQKEAESKTKMSDVEKILNDEGLEGWEIVNIFAVRTTFDPNVFFVAMKRPLPPTGDTLPEMNSSEN
ncbi:MAG: DUF4177 domain-containing protein [Synergistaceae bacterium]|jgi:hypothetical protein|nr:DUF4177 domain-containing protein [Synergistaceae bacterium]